MGSGGTTSLEAPGYWNDVKGNYEIASAGESQKTTPTKAAIAISIKTKRAGDVAGRDMSCRLAENGVPV